MQTGYHYHKRYSQNSDNLHTPVHTKTRKSGKSYLVKRIEIAPNAKFTLIDIKSSNAANSEFFQFLVQQTTEDGEEQRAWVYEAGLNRIGNFRTQSSMIGNYKKRLKKLRTKCPNTKKVVKTRLFILDCYESTKQEERSLRNKLIVKALPSIGQNSPPVRKKIKKAQTSIKKKKTSKGNSPDKQKEEDMMQLYSHPLEKRSATKSLKNSEGKLSNTKSEGIRTRNKQGNKMMVLDQPGSYTNEDLKEQQESERAAQFLREKGIEKVQELKARYENSKSMIKKEDFFRDLNQLKNSLNAAFKNTFEEEDIE